MNPNIANAILEAFLSIACGPLIPVIMLALMSPSKRPVRTGAGIAAGAIIVVAAFVLILLAIFDYSGDSGSGKFGYLVYLVLGIVFLLLGIKTVIKPPESGESEDAAVKKLAKIAEGGMGGLLLVGVLGAILNSDQLVVLVGAVHDIAVSGVPNSTQLIVAIVVIIIATFLWWIMPISVGIGGEGAKRFLARLNVWLTKNMRMIEIVVFLVLGVYFLVRGLQGLI
ncbi:MAG: GAP family protein [Anaerolineae bacterium]